MRPLFFSWGYLAPLMDFVQHTLETAPFWRGSKPIFNQFFWLFLKDPENIRSLAGFMGVSDLPPPFKRQKRIFCL